VPAAERKAYLDALTRSGATYFWQQERAPEKKAELQEPSGGRSEVILRTLALQAAAKDAEPELSQLITQRLLEHGRYFRDTYESRGEFVRSVQAPSRFLRAEQAWMSWALAALTTLPAEERYKLWDLLIVPSRSSPRLLLEPRAFPGFSLPKAGNALLDEWVRAGYPTAAPNYKESEDAKTRLFDQVICPTGPDHRGFQRQHARNCYAAFYATSVNSADTREALFQRALTTPDARLFYEISINVHMLASGNADFPRDVAVPAVLELWRRAEKVPARFRELTRLYAVEIDRSTYLREALYDQTTRYYREKPEYRGELLFLLSRIDGYGRTEVNWKNFAATYGAPITMRELSTYLEQGPLAFERFRQLQHALPAGSSPGSLLAQRLKRYLDDPVGEKSGRPMVVRVVASVLQKIGDRPGLEAFARELRTYVGTDPQRERVFRDTLAEVERLTQSEVARR